MKILLTVTNYSASWRITGRTGKRGTGPKFLPSLYVYASEDELSSIMNNLGPNDSERT
jgi:hypothetical protein